MKKIFYLLLSLLMIAFIFGNSMMDASDSNNESRFIMNFVRYLLDWLGFHVQISQLHHIVRKCAHFTEFALEAFFVVKALAAFGMRRQTWLAYALLIGLLTAVIDENIQLYSIGRSSQVSDILLDFSGTLAGVIVAWIAGGKRKRT